MSEQLWEDENTKYRMILVRQTNRDAVTVAVMRYTRDPKLDKWSAAEARFGEWAPTVEGATLDPLFEVFGIATDMVGKAAKEFVGGSSDQLRAEIKVLEGKVQERTAAAAAAERREHVASSERTKLIGAIADALESAKDRDFD